MQRSDFHTRIYDFQTVILRLYAPVFGGNSYENDKFLSFLCIFFIHLEPILDTIISIVTKK